MNNTHENSVTLPVFEESVDASGCDESDEAGRQIETNDSIQNAHVCNGDNQICPFQDEVIPTIKAFCDEKRFTHALREAESYVITKCPQIIIFYCSLSLKLNQTKEVVTYIECLTVDKCVEIIDKFRNKNISVIFGIQKYVQKTITLLLNRAVVQLLLNGDVETTKLIRYLKFWIERNISMENFENMVKKILEVGIPNHNVFVLFDTLKDFNRGPNNYLMLKWEIFIRAITSNLNLYEYLKFSVECNENHLFEEEKNISSRYLQLAELCSYNIPVQSECLLTAYSLNPTPKIYNLIIANSVKINRLKPPTPPKPKENACCKNLYFNTLCDKCGDIKSKESALQLNDSNRNILSNECTEEIFSGKVFFVDGNVTNNDESLQQMATDLITILTCPRNKLITWELEWETLNQNLLCLLKPNNKINLVKQYTANANSKLQFLKLDYNEYRHLPEPELPGIEKGYEAYLDTDYETDDENSASTRKAVNNGIVKSGKSEVSGAPEPRKIESKKKDSRKKNSLEASIIKLVKLTAATSGNQPTASCLDRLSSNGKFQPSSDIVEDPSHSQVTNIIGKNLSPSIASNKELLVSKIIKNDGPGQQITQHENDTNDLNTKTQNETSSNIDINCQLDTIQQIPESFENVTNKIITPQTETSNIDLNYTETSLSAQIQRLEETYICSSASREGNHVEDIKTSGFRESTETTYSSTSRQIEFVNDVRAVPDPKYDYLLCPEQMETEEVPQSNFKSNNPENRQQTLVTSVARLCLTKVEALPNENNILSKNKIYKVCKQQQITGKMDPKPIQQTYITIDPNGSNVNSERILTNCVQSIEDGDDRPINIPISNSIKNETSTMFQPVDNEQVSSVNIENHNKVDLDCAIDQCISSICELNKSSVKPDFICNEEQSYVKIPKIVPVESVNIENQSKLHLDCSIDPNVLSNCNSEIKNYEKSSDIKCNKELDHVTTPDPGPVESVEVKNHNNVHLDCSIDQCVSPNSHTNNKSYVNLDITCEEQLSVATQETESINSVSDRSSDCEQIKPFIQFGITHIESSTSILEPDMESDLANLESGECEIIALIGEKSFQQHKSTIVEIQSDKMEELPSDVSEEEVLKSETSSTENNNTSAVSNHVSVAESETTIENSKDSISRYDEEHLYLETLEKVVNDIRSEEINAWSPVAVANLEEITEVIKFDIPYYFDSDFCIELEDYGEDAGITCENKEETFPSPIEDLIWEPEIMVDDITSVGELKSSTPNEENNNFNVTKGIYLEKSPEVANDRLDLLNIAHSEQNGVFHEGTIQEQFDNVTYPEGMAKLKELKVVVKPFIRECHIPLKRLKLDSDDGSHTFKVTEVSNGQHYGFESVIVLNDASVQKRLLPTINLKAFSHSNSNQINSMCQLINLKRRKSSANNIIYNKRPRISDPDLHNKTPECDIDSNKISDEIPFRWSKQSIKNYGRPKNKNFYKEGSYLKKYEKRCITPSSLLINSNLYNSTLNKPALKLNGGGCITITNKSSNLQKSYNKSDKNTVFNNVPGLKTYEHLKISQNVRNQAVNIIEVFNSNKSNCVNSSTVNSGNSSTIGVNSTSNQTVEVVSNPSTSGSVFHHFVQFNNSKGNGNQNISGFVPGEASVPQTNPSAIKTSQNIVQFLCKTDGKKIQLTPITNQRISHIQINRISNENETGQERENQTTDTILPKFNQAFNNRTATLVSHDQSGVPTTARNLPVLSKLQITPSRPVRISMPMVQKSHSATSSTTTASMVSRSIIQLPLRQLNQMGSNLGVSTFPRQVLITAAPTRLNSVSSVITTTTEETPQVAAKPSTTNSSNNKSLDTSTLEQLREFDMVLEQVKERSISSCSNIKEETVITPKATPVTASTSVIQKVNLRNVAFFQQKRGNNDTPVVVLCGSNLKNKTLNIDTKNVTNTTKSITVSTSPLQMPQAKEERSPTPAELQPATSVQKPPQKLQEDEQTIQRIYDILAEYAEQLRNSPDLKNKPAPRRRSNPTINTVCSTSSQVSNDNDSSSNSSITTAVPPVQIKQTVNCSETEANNNSSTVLLISSAAISKKQITEDRCKSVASRKLLISETTASKADFQNKSTITPPTNTQPALANKIYSNNCIPLNIMKRQQITILSGSKVLTTLPTNQKSNIRNDPIILKTLQSTTSIKSINNSTRSFPNTASPIFVLSSPRNANNKPTNSEITINSLNNGHNTIKNTTHTATSATHFATTANGGLNNNNIKMAKESSILEKEIKLQKSLSEECEDLGVDEPSASDLFPEADLLLDANTNSPITSSVDDEYYNSPSATLLYNNNKINNETDLPTMNFNYNNSNNGSMIVKQNNKKRVYGSANWLRGSGNSTRKIVKLSSSAVSPVLENSTSASMEAHNMISISLASKNGNSLA